MPDTLPHWERFAREAAPDEATVHVIAFSLEDGGEGAWRCLSGEERARAQRLRDACGQRRFVAARAGLRGILARHLGRPPEDVPLVADDRGKPALAGDAALRFNVAHSHELALVALACGHEVGVDVEREREEVAITEVAAQVFSLREREGLLALPPRDQRRAFFACWTRKEALLKATGEGLRRAPASVDLAPRAGESGWRRWAVLDGVPFAVCDLPPLPGFGAAVAVRGGIRRLRCFALEEAVP